MADAAYEILRQDKKESGNFYIVIFVIKIGWVDTEEEGNHWLCEIQVRPQCQGGGSDAGFLHLIDLIHSSDW